MDKTHLAVFVAEADIGPPGLEIQEVAAGGNLSVGVKAGQPNFDVVGFGGAETNITGSQANNAVRQLGLSLYKPQIYQYPV